MRTILFAVLVGALAGCGKRDKGDDKGDDESDAPKRVEKKSRGTPQKVDAGDLESQYRKNGGQHPHHGKLVLVRAHGYLSFGTMAGDEVVIMHDASDGFRRPDVAFRFQKSELVRKGGQKGTLYIEGYLRGPTAFKEVPWAKEWLALTPQSGSSPDTFVLVDECVLAK